MLSVKFKGFHVIIFYVETFHRGSEAQWYFDIVLMFNKQVSKFCVIIRKATGREAQFDPCSSNRELLCSL